jgi:3-mercaptopyruvate sulfurtransferase SseA
MTASWLIQLGWRDAFVLEPEGLDGFSGWPVARGAHRPAVLGLQECPTIAPAELHPLIAAPGLAVIDLATSLQYRDRHIPGAWWAVRARLAETRAKIGAPTEIVLTGGDALLARLAAADAAALWPAARIAVLEGGNPAWYAAGYVAEAGLERATTATDDVWYKPYDHREDAARHMQAYLDWEVALVEQVKRDPTIFFRAFA